MQSFINYHNFQIIARHYNLILKGLFQRDFNLGIIQISILLHVLNHFILLIYHYNKYSLF